MHILFPALLLDRFHRYQVSTSRSSTFPLCSSICRTNFALPHFTHCLSPHDCGLGRLHGDMLEFSCFLLLLIYLWSFRFGILFQQCFCFTCGSVSLLVSIFSSDCAIYCHRTRFLVFARVNFFRLVSAACLSSLHIPSRRNYRLTNITAGFCYIDPCRRGDAALRSSPPVRLPHLFVKIRWQEP